MASWDISSVSSINLVRSCGTVGIFVSSNFEHFLSFLLNALILDRLFTRVDKTKTMNTAANNVQQH